MFSSKQLYKSKSKAPLLSEAFNTFLKLKRIGKDKTFTRGVKRNLKYVTKSLEDLPIDCNDNRDASSFRNWIPNIKMSYKNYITSFRFIF